MKEIHQPVLLEEVIKYLNVSENKNFIDATVDGAVLAEVILEKIKPSGRLLGIEWDERLINLARERLAKFGRRSLIVHSNYIKLAEIVRGQKFENVNGIVFDLGLSNFHLEISGRGFSFLRNEPLDMRFSQAQQAVSAREIVNNYPPDKLEKIIKDYGQERYARKITEAIVKSRHLKPISTTLELVKIITGAVSYNYQRSKIHPATRTFQALRIAVNNELENLKTGLTQAFQILNLGGRLVVISFHSLEDKIVKEFFQNKKNQSKILTPKPVLPTSKEISINPKARSAKLRVLEKI